MRIAVNALYLRPGVVGGGETYVHELLRELGREGCVTVFCWRGAAESLRTISGIEVRALFGGAYSHLRRLAAEARYLPAALRAVRADVVLSTGNHAVAAPGVTTPQVVTVHDLQHLWFPQYFSLPQRAYRSAMLRRTVRLSKLLIAISAFTRSDVVARYGVDERRVRCVLNGVSAAEVPGEEVVAATLARYGLTRPFFYYPAMMAPHKNHELLLRALRVLRERGRGNATVVLTGAGAQEELASKAEALGLSGRIRHLGTVPRADVWALLAGAAGLVFPSRFEGFGLPLVEAMQCGTPVIGASCGSIPEVVGNAGVLLGPDDAEGWASAMIDVAEDPALRRRLASAAARNVERFSWQRCAQETLAVLREAAGTN